MISNEILNKTYMNEDDLDAFYNSQFEQMEFPWLENVRQWIIEAYNAKVMTISYKCWNENNRDFWLYCFSDDDDARIPYEGEMNQESAKTVERKIAELSGFPLSSITCRKDWSFVDHCKLYLNSNVSFKFKDELPKFYKEYSPFVVVNRGKTCVFNTKKEAKDFLLNGGYEKVRRKLFDLLKPFDRYNVLEEADVRILVDFKDNYIKWGDCYCRWIDDLSEREWDEYMRKIIESDESDFHKQQI